MTSNFETATDEMLALFKTAWDTTAYANNVAWPNVEYSPPTDNDSGWARIGVTHVTGRTTTLTGEGNVRRHEHTGFVGVEIYVPGGEGLRELNQLAKLVKDAFEDQHTASGVWFSNVRFQPIGADGQWHRGDVLADFRYDEVR